MPFWRLYAHLVWGTKQREPMIDVAWETVIRRSLEATCAELGVLVHGIGTMPEHVHLAVSIPPRLAVADVVRRLKGSSSHLVNHAGANAEASGAPFAWQAEYGALSFGDRSYEAVVAYVKTQRERHAAGDLWPMFEQQDRPFDPTNRDASSS